MLNRHRGESYLSSPATPPDMRVRIGRFRGLRKSIEELGETEGGKVRNGERVLQSGTAAQSPRAERTARRLGGEILTNAALT